MNIAKAAVLGAGTMGAGIAAHLSNAGIPTLLLDIAPNELNEAEAAKGLTLESPQVRNRIVNSLFDAAKKLKPAPFMLGDNAKLITTGNFTDDLAKLKDCDFVIEAVVENLEIKHKLFAEVEQTSQARCGDRFEHERHSDRLDRRAVFGRFQGSILSAFTSLIRRDI